MRHFKRFSVLMLLCLSLSLCDSLHLCMCANHVEKPIITMTTPMTTTIASMWSVWIKWFDSQRRKLKKSRLKSEIEFFPHCTEPWIEQTNGNIYIICFSLRSMSHTEVSATKLHSNNKKGTNKQAPIDAQMHLRLWWQRLKLRNKFL